MTARLSNGLLQHPGAINIPPMRWMIRFLSVLSKYHMSVALKNCIAFRGWDQVMLKLRSATTHYSPSVFLHEERDWRVLVWLPFHGPEARRPHKTKKYSRRLTNHGSLVPLSNTLRPLCRIASSWGKSPSRLAPHLTLVSQTAGNNQFTPH